MQILAARLGRVDNYEKTAKKALDIGDGWDIHHIVEQAQEDPNLGGFPASRINLSAFT